jgi:hypothetical protein
MPLTSTPAPVFVLDRPVIIPPGRYRTLLFFLTSPKQGEASSLEKVTGSDLALFGCSIGPYRVGTTKPSDARRGVVRAEFRKFIRLQRTKDVFSRDDQGSNAETKTGAAEITLDCIFHTTYNFQLAKLRTCETVHSEETQRPGINGLQTETVYGYWDK